MANPHQIKNISDLIEFTKNTPEEQYEKFGQIGLKMQGTLL
jgi:hypothetical protein